MEQILARLLFSALEGNDDTKEKVIKLLKFYRENRELLLMLFSAALPQTKAVSGGQAERSEEKAEPEKENRPRETAGSVRILEDYLNRAV